MFDCSNFFLLKHKELLILLMNLLSGQGSEGMAYLCTTLAGVALLGMGASLCGRWAVSG